MALNAPAGFYYKMWIAADIKAWTENLYGDPDAEFYTPTGVPAFAQKFTREDMAPTFTARYRCDANSSYKAGYLVNRELGPLWPSEMPSKV